MNATTTTLIQALGSPEGSDRREAALAMGAASDPSVVPALLDRIRVEQNSCVREDLTWAIVQHAETAGPVLLEMVGSDDPGERRTAAHVISKLGDSLHFEAVSRLVADEDPDVAIKAYRAAANTGGASAVDLLATRLGDGDLHQRDALTNAFHSLGDASVPALISALSSRDAEVREHAAESLGHLGEEAASAAAQLEEAAADAEPAVRLAAIAALGQLGESSEAGLRRLVDGGDPLVAKVAKAYLG